MSSTHSPSLQTMSSTDSIRLQTSSYNMNVFSTAFFSILIPLSIGGNLLVIITFCIVKKLKRNPSNYLIVSLAITDLLLTSVVLIPYFITEQMEDWIFGVEFCRIYLWTNILSPQATFLNLCAISIDRYLRIKYALHYDLMISPVKVGLAIFCVWFLAALQAFGAIYLSSYLKLPGDDTNIIDYVQCKMYNNSIRAMSFSSFFFVACFIMMVMYFKIFRIARSHADHIETHSIRKSPKRKGTRFERKAVFTLAVTTGVFVACWLPFNVCLLLNGVSPGFVAGHYLAFTLYLGWANSGFNPIIYSIFNTQYRRAFIRILSCEKMNFDSMTSAPTSSRRPSSMNLPKSRTPEHSS